MGEEDAAVAIIAIGCGTGILFGVLNHVSAIAKKWIETGLKREMVARGYTADEIVAVIQSERTAIGSTPMGNVPPAKAIRQPAPTY